MKKPLYQTTAAFLMGVMLPTETRTYKPISHEELIVTTRDTIQKCGLHISSELYEATREGQVANGRYIIKDLRDAEMSLMIAWQNSYNKQVTLKFAIGTHIFICENGCVSGDFGSFKKKHVGQIQTYTPTAIEEYIKSSEQTFYAVSNDRDAMKATTITQRERAELIGRLTVEKQILGSTQMNTIIKELRNPRFQYSDSESLWQLYQIITYALKTSAPSEWMGDHLAVHELFAETLIEKSQMHDHTEDTVPYEDVTTDSQLTLFGVDDDIIS